jgi:hypothetical protein
MTIAYKCVICDEWCEQAPTTDEWISIGGLKAIHFRCLNHLRELQDGFRKDVPPPCPDCGRPMVRREPWTCNNCGEEMDV